MAVTVTTTNYTELSNCDTLTSGGTWTGGNARTTETDFYKYGTACIAYTVRTATTHDLDFAPTASVDLTTGSPILRLWFLSSATIDLETNGGLQFYISDGANTAYWTVGGGDTYPGGWYLFSVDTSTTQTTGTKPTMTAVTNIGLRVITTVGTKNVPTTYIDHLHRLDGLVAYGDNGAGVPFSLSDIYAADNTTSTAWGAVSRIKTVYYLSSSLEIGHSAGATNTDFEIVDETVVFDTAPVSSYTVDIVEGTGTTNVDIIRSTLKAAGQPYTFSTTVTGTGINVLGASMINAGTIDFAATNNIKNSTFIACGQIDPSTSAFEGNTITQYVGTEGGALLWPGGTTVKDCIFDYNEKSIEITQTSTQTYDNLRFPNEDNTTHQSTHLNNGGTSITVNKSNGSNPLYYTATGGGVVTFAASISINVHVEDQSGADVASAYVYLDEDNTSPFILNTTTDINGGASGSYSGAATTGTLRIRKYGYRPYVGTVDLTVDINANVTLITDPQQT